MNMDVKLLGANLLCFSNGVLLCRLFIPSTLKAL